MRNGTSRRAILQVVVACAVLAVSAGCSPSGSRGASASTAATKPDITELTASMLVDQSSFPTIDGGKWQVGGSTKNGAVPNRLPVEPTECSVIVYGLTSSQAAAVSLSASDTFIGIILQLTQERPDVKALPQTCRTYEQGDGSTATVTSLVPSGLPTWAVVLDTEYSNDSRGLNIMGFCRGVFVRAIYSDPSKASSELAEPLLRIFNAEVAKLETS
jgi:hypothetical protein